MKKILFIILITQFVFSEALLKIDNFIDNGSSITFDVMMKNEEPVGGAQLTILSGDGVYDTTSSSNDCICSYDCSGSGDTEVCWGTIPDGCLECYYDNGLDFVLNAYEEGYYGVGNSCSEGGACGNASFATASECEEAGICNGNAYTSDDDLCFIGDAIQTTISDSVTCVQSGIDPNLNICTGTDANGDGQDDACVDDNESTLCCSFQGSWSAYSSSECNESGTCADSQYTDECECLQEGSTWDSDEYTWSPTSLWTSYSLPYLCDDNGNDWNYANQDASGDGYRTLIDPTTCTEAIDCAVAANDNHPCCSTIFQFCRMPGLWSSDPSDLMKYQAYRGLQYACAEDDLDEGEDCTVFESELDLEGYEMAGHCSQIDPYCKDLECTSIVDENSGNSITTCTQDTNEDGICDSGGLACNNGWSSECCNMSQNSGWIWTDPHRDYKDCVENFGASAWTGYDNQTTCEEFGGIWVGRENGSEENGAYDLGENFVDKDVNINITGVSNLPGAWGGSVGTTANDTQNEILMFSFTGATIPASSNYVRLATVSATVSGTVGDVVTLGARNICKDNYKLQCVSEMIISDATSSRLDSYFLPSIWTIGSGAHQLGSTEALNDNVCSSYAGETMETDSSCDSYCGDSYCDTSEDYVTCKMDCPDVVDGDGYCNFYENENAGTSVDCEAFGCGDYYCSGTETINNCSFDCPSYCGDGYCDIAGGENGINCSQDGCGNFTIGDGACGSSEGENYCISPDDCASTCGDNCYHHAGIGGTENNTCEDYQIVCGDNVYHYEDLELNGISPGEATAESFESCPGDYVQTCGDGYYDHAGIGGTEDDTEYCTLEGVIYSQFNENTCGLAGLGVSGNLITTCGVGDCADYLVWDYCDYPDTEGGLLGDGVCDESLIADENPGIEAACLSTCGDGFYHHSGLAVSGDEETTCGTDYPDDWDIQSACGDGICDGQLIGSESVPNGNGENTFTCPGDCSGTLSDGYCDEFGLFGTVETASNAPSDCAPSCGDGVCARFGWDGSDPTSIAEETTESCETDCTYNMCGNGICEAFWEEELGTTAMGTCDKDCASTDGTCTFGESVNSNSWYSYSDCYTCDTSNACTATTNDGCQEGFGETAIDGGYGDNAFCYCDCWVDCTSGEDCCGNGICEGPEDDRNCYGEGVYSDPYAGGDGSWTLDPSSEGDCLSVVENNIPLDYTLSNNYPNPFNPVTTINYSVKNPGNVKIDIYNILGQHVYTLVNQYCIPGVMYQIVWDASTDSKIPLSSGVYFYQMISGDFEQEGRMTIIK